ncbi:hypothetical protein BN14_07273 [Rhizoctonia solani AG-1 IB]|uniref:Uncharacterized protein n=1 Tax=Thanatephorus cucumeris (strain AG1-IB / isolate 7/3/14) TaxID=1108050 RepID=M5C2F7_THACB|nr:hypothetical protein BN14_07273 [Rhizoctonia solani AG-1 IB]
MSDPSSFDIHVWNASRPNQATRTRPNTRAPNTFRVSRQDPDTNPSPLPSTSHFMTTTWSPPPSTTPPTSSPRAQSMSRSYSDQNAHAAETAPPGSQMMLLRELGYFSSSEIANALVTLGLSHRAMDAPVQRGGRLPDIHMLSPWPNDRSGQYMRICGYAYTVKMAPAANTHPLSILPQIIDAAPMGSIIVVSVPPNMNAAVWDNIMTAHAKNRGIRGQDFQYLLRDTKRLCMARWGSFTQPKQMDPS